MHLDDLPEIDISLTGFEIPEIDLIIGEEVSDKNSLEEVPALAETAVTHLGDLWLLGDHRIYCGDARDLRSYETLMEGNRAAVAFTDPSYNVAIHGHASGNGRTHHREFAMASGEMSKDQFAEFLSSALGKLAQFSSAGAVHFVAMNWRHSAEILEAGGKVYDSLLNLCVWNKDKGGMGSFYRSQHELIFVFKVGKSRHRNNIQLGKFGRYKTNIWNYPSASTISRRSDGGMSLRCIQP